MPCRYEIFSDINLVRITCTGRLTRDDLITLLDELDNHPDFHPNIDDLIDLREVTEIDISPDVGANLLDLMVGVTLRAKRAKRIAILVSSETARESAAKFREAMRRISGIKIGLFDSPRAAVEFLGRSGPKVSSLLSGMPGGEAELTLRSD